ncbi:MAG TPA: histidine kinase [Acidimicrobiales bacterium]|nr:histidine kinase [Acidimicrobiales bacterium]
MTTAVARPGVTYRYRTSRVAFGVFFLLMGVAFMLDSAGAFKVTTGIFWPLFVVSLGAGLLLHRARRLMVEEDRSAQLAVAEERVRIARELHDIVAHGVSLMTIQIAAARRVATKNPSSAAESLEAAEETGRQTLTELEGMLAALRGADASIGAAARTGQTATGGDEESRSPLPRISDLEALVDAVRQTGRTIRYDVLGDAPALPARVETTVYRLVQEALTNAVRYAGESPIDIQVIFSPAAITVFVDDAGPGTAGKAKAGGGHGLAGMRERLAAVGGTLEAGPKQPGPGWRVYATIPIVLLEAS